MMDAASLATGAPAMRRSLVLSACMMATFMAAVESTIVATAMPSIAAKLGGFSLFSWVFSAYMLTQAVTIPIYGRLADIYGRKRLFYVGAGLFLVGSISCGLSTSMLQLVMFRVLQGIGAGGVQPIANTIVGDIYTPSERARIQGLLSSVFAVSALAGPSLGAFLVAYASWQVVFWVNLPIGIAAIVMIAAFLPESVQHRAHRVDYAGSALLALTVGAFMLLLVQGSSLDRTQMAAAGAVGLCAAVLLAWHEWRTPEPLLPLELWRNRVIVIGSVGSCVTGAIVMGIAAFLPAYVQGAMGRSAALAGSILGLMTVVWALSSAVAGQILVRTTYRFTATLGSVLLVVGCLTLIAATPARGPGWAASGAMLAGIGMGLCNTTFMVSVQAAVSWQQRGAATSSAMFLRFLGQALGAAGFGAMINFSLMAQGPAASQAVDELMDPRLRRLLPTETIATLSDVVASGMHNGYLLAGLLAVLALGLARLLPARLGPANQPARR
jgi:EmrB/QacA subfamily drug resistance transporter